MIFIRFVICNNIFFGSFQQVIILNERAIIFTLLPGAFFLPGSLFNFSKIIQKIMGKAVVNFFTGNIMQSCVVCIVGP